MRDQEKKSLNTHTVQADVCTYVNILVQADVHKYFTWQTAMCSITMHSDRDTTNTIVLVGECSAFLASGSEPTDESRMTPDHTSERTGSLR